MDMIHVTHNMFVTCLVVIAHKTTKFQGQAEGIRVYKSQHARCTQPFCHTHGHEGGDYASRMANSR